MPARTTTIRRSRTLRRHRITSVARRASRPPTQSAPAAAVLLAARPVLARPSPVQFAITLSESDSKNASSYTNTEESLAQTEALKMLTTVAEPTAVVTRVMQISSKDDLATMLAKATKKASAAEVARIYRSERPLKSRGATKLNARAQKQNAPTSGETVRLQHDCYVPGQRRVDHHQVLGHSEHAATGAVSANPGHCLGRQFRQRPDYRSGDGYGGPNEDEHRHADDLEWFQQH